jgi:hypothetical protein
MKAFLTALICGLVAGCASRAPVVILPLYDDAMYAPYATPGTATVHGSAFLVTRAGDVKKAAARTVFLIPDTPFLAVRTKDAETDGGSYTTFEWLGWSGTDQESITKAWQHTRTEVGDMDGKFSFAKVPAGNYIVETKLIWQYVNCGFLGCRLSDTGAVLRKRIILKDGETIEARLTSEITR